MNDLFKNYFKPTRIFHCDTYLEDLFETSLDFKLIESAEHRILTVCKSKTPCESLLIIELFLYKSVT